MALEGKLTAVADVRRVLAGLRAPEPLVSRLARELGHETESLVEDCFLGQQDPWGRAWPKTLRGGAMLRDTGRLFNSRSVQASAGQVRVTFPVLYAGIHNRGGTVVARTKKYLRFRVGRGKGGRWASKRAVTVPARTFLPEGGALPPSWEARYAQASEEFFAERLSEAGL